ncbi:acyl carrier protein [Fictibacillus phosphorivorans]|uniref:acyl carrier protein n=1 Tax=Fictibacillus phosphorivorans TaxID=1221500 RepID=UPI003CF229FA
MNEAYKAITKNIIEILPDIQKAEINQEYSLRDLGANSIDRMEIIVMTMEDLEVQIPLMEFANAQNIGEITRIMVREKELKKHGMIKDNDS